MSIPFLAGYGLWDPVVAASRRYKCSEEILSITSCHVVSQVQVFRGDPVHHRDAVRQQRRLLPAEGQDRPRRYGEAELLRARRWPPHPAQCLQPGQPSSSLRRSVARLV